MDYLSSLTVVQHTSAEYLGLIEDHLEGRKIRFNYHRPFTERGGIPRPQDVGDGLVLLGGGPWGTAGPRNVPTLVREVELAAYCLDHDIAVIGIGLGAQILSLAAGGKSIVAPLRFRIEHADRVDEHALNGFLPKRYLNVVYMRDDFEIPGQARILALGEDQRPALFQIGDRAFGFSGHPGFKAAIAEDLIMEFEQAPADPAETLAALRARKHDIEDQLVEIMTGLVQLTGWMDRKP